MIWGGSTRTRIYMECRCVLNDLCALIDFFDVSSSWTRWWLLRYIGLNLFFEFVNGLLFFYDETYVSTRQRLTPKNKLYLCMFCSFQLSHQYVPCQVHVV